jgi:transposase
MPRLKFVRPLSDTDKQELDALYKTHPNFKVRRRAHALLLSGSGHTINQLQAIFQVDRDPISQWIDRFNAQGVDGLGDLPRSGRPPIYTPEEIALFRAQLDEEPRQIKQAQALLEARTRKKSATGTLRRILKNSIIHGGGADAP